MPKIDIPKSLPEREAKIIIGELTLREIEKIYALREWKKELSIDVIRKILTKIIEEGTSSNIEIIERKEDAEHYVKKLQFFKVIMDDLVRKDSSKISSLATKEDCERGLANAIDIVTKIAKEHNCAFQLSFEVSKEINELLKKELGVVLEKVEVPHKKAKVIDFYSIMEEIKPELFSKGLTLTKRHHPILYAEKQSIIKDLIGKMLERSLDLDVKNAQKSIEYGYLEKNPQKVKKYIYSSALESLKWWITNIFEDLIVTYEPEVLDQ